MWICDRGVNWFQVINAEGDCRVCGWARNAYVGNLLQEDIKNIMHSEKSEAFRKSLLDGSYSNCDRDNCPFLANDKMDDILVDIEKVPDYPNGLFLAYEGVCNYNCTCCTSHMHMEDTKNNDYTENYLKLEEKLRDILPHVKLLSANGRGELFASKRTLKMLSEWKPLAPKEEIKVILETNGSLFDEKHWKQIENLGQYDLKVAITIMSFNEKIYQHLSGTKLPISRIEDNLRYVKKLREQGVINHLELATVLQEENFREMPEFTRRCIEEFGADKVRIRPIVSGGIYDNNIQWFMDVRNPEHPYYEQYVETMKHSIFKHPKVLLWSGEIESSRGKHPGVKTATVQKMIDRMMDDAEFTNKLASLIDEKEILLYGLGTVGKVLLKINEGQLSINKIIDNYSKQKAYMGIPVCKACEVEEKAATIIVSIYGDFKQIEKDIRSQGFTGQLVNIYSIIV